MSNGNSPNVTSMHQHELITPPSAQGQKGSDLRAQDAGQLLKQCREMAQQRLGSSLTSMLDKVEETLLSMADAASDRETRDLYIQAKDKANAQRAAIEAQFKKRFESEFEQRANKQGKIKQDEPDSFDISTLTLVDHDALIESLKVKDLSTKMRGVCDEELRALDQRIGVLLKDPNLKDDDNPLGPDTIYNAFKQACDEIEASLKVKMIILNLFDQHVHTEIQGIYRDINALLIKNSVLPKIRLGFGRSFISGEASGAAAGAAMAAAGHARLAAPAGGGTPGAAGFGAQATTLPGGEQDFFGMLQGLLARQHGGGMPVAGAAASFTTLSGFPAGFEASTPGEFPSLAARLGAASGAVRMLSGEELLVALTQMQQGHASVVQGVPNALAATIAEPGGVNILRDIKTTQFGKGMGEVDNMTLDIVAMLFDHILEDKKIPDAMKALIGRLQIPILKVAILDKTFFQKKHHPARRMLNTLGEFGLGLGPDFHTSNLLFKQVEAILQKLIDQFEDDLSLFEKAEADLERVIETENRRAGEQASRTARLLELREKLEVARATAQREIKKRAESGPMPQTVLKFLAEEWIKLLVMAHAKSGSGSDAWKSATETMDQLIWSVSAKPSSDDRRRLGTLLPALLKRIQRGMQIVGTRAEVRTKFLSKLMRCHTKVINGAADSLRKAARIAAQAPPPSTPAPAASPMPPEIPTLCDVVEMPTESSEPASTFAPRSILEELTPTHRPSIRATPAAAVVEPPLPAEFGFDSSSESSSDDSLPPEFEEVAGASMSSEMDEDTRLAETLPSFKSMSIKNPFGEGEIEVEEISLDNLPAFSSNQGGRGDTLASRTGDEHSLKAGSMAVGTWIELRSADDARVQARLSWISPLKGTYLFTNRHGAKVAEFSLYQLAKEMRQGGCVIMEEVPLFDRAMSSLVGVLRKEG